MKTSNLIVLAAVLFAAAASAIALADFGDPPGGSQNMNIERNPPPNTPCYCPAIWDPVVCGNEAGEVRRFSSPCLAGCYGFTHCAQFQPHP